MQRRRQNYRKETKNATPILNTIFMNAQSHISMSYGAVSTHGMSTTLQIYPHAKNLVK